VVQAGEARVLKVSSRREAAKLVTDAAVLLQQEPASGAGEGSSIGRDTPEVP
jgi:isoaspartyl peptidase/L-asparaginase-like protein (Ntn-hydrolase superfamily)